MNRRVLGFDIVMAGDPLPEHLQEQPMPEECKGYAGDLHRIRHGLRKSMPAQGGTHGHCWHKSDFVKLSIPPQWDETCCHCGEVSTMLGTITEEPGHGPHGTREITTYRRIKARR